MRVFRHKKLCIPILVRFLQKVLTSNVVRTGFEIKKQVSTSFRSLIQSLRHYWSTPFSKILPKLKTIAIFTFYSNGPKHGVQYYQQNLSSANKFPSKSEPFLPISNSSLTRINTLKYFHTTQKEPDHYQIILQFLKYRSF